MFTQPLLIFEGVDPIHHTTPKLPQVHPCRFHLAKNGFFADSCAAITIRLGRADPFVIVILASQINIVANWLAGDICVFFYVIGFWRREPPTHSDPYKNFFATTKDFTYVLLQFLNNFTPTAGKFDVLCSISEIYKKYAAYLYWSQTLFCVGSILKSNIKCNI